VNFDKFKAINDEQRNVGTLESPSVVGTFQNDACGDDYVVYLQVEGDVIRDAKFTTTGCGFGLAALSLGMEWIKGKTLLEASKITAEDIEAGVDGFPERRRRYPQTAVELIRSTIRSYSKSPSEDAP
jgi:NifU-like protein involved in Fe-S cluster formation